jgi:penicillin-binding protein 1C
MNRLLLLRTALRKLLSAWWRAIRRRPLRWGLGLALLLGYAWCLPDPLFDAPVSTILTDREGRLLDARIARDEQWRFPQRDQVPAKFATCITRFEDQRFWYHPGVDPLAMLRALWLNVSQGTVVSGGSTLTMQVIRLSRQGQARTLGEKLIELVLATRATLRYAKSSILGLYASYAPFGGNVVGLDAAAWKYFGRAPEQLSWAEMATLAVLPNAPALIHPGRNRDALRRKRDALLDRLLAHGDLDSLTHELALLETLPAAPMPLPHLAPHLLARHHANLPAHPSTAQSRLRSTLDRSLQQRSSQILAHHHQRLQGQGIHNAGALIVAVATGDILAYLGNTPCHDGTHGCRVDVTTARRSTGSILKPFLYASMLSDGELLPHTLLPDVPSYFGGYSPSNYDQTYRGAVPASRALARSLNVPAVRMLQSHGVTKFQDELQRLGLTTLDRSAEDYGLSLILGGGEATLADLAAAYAGMARSLNQYRAYNGRYAPQAYRPLNYDAAASRGPLEPAQHDQLVRNGPLGAGAIWHTFEAMVMVTRPSVEAYWEFFDSDERIAWKTGTSFGYRDAWAIGTTPDYVIAVWVGNADGEGRDGLVGGQVAAPILFDLYDALGGQRRWFVPPYDDLRQVATCRESGHRASSLCPVIDSVWVPLAGLRTLPCPYHEVIRLDPSGQYQVHSDCESPQTMQQDTLLVLPPTQAWYYRKRHPSYRVPPPYRPDCLAHLPSGQTATPMQWIYPQQDTRIYVPVELNGEQGKVVFEVAHREQVSVLYWHLDEQYLGETVEIHQMALSPPPGEHLITVVDAAGHRLTRAFTVVAEP